MHERQRIAQNVALCCICSPLSHEPMAEALRVADLRCKVDTPPASATLAVWPLMEETAGAITQAVKLLLRMQHVHTGIPGSVWNSGF